MKVKVKEKYLDKLKSEVGEFWEVGEFDENQEYIVLGICIYVSTSEERRMDYIIKELYYGDTDYNHFYITEESIPSGWSIRDGMAAGSVFMAFGDLDRELYDEFNCDSDEYSRKAHKREARRYHELEVEDFFAQSNLEDSEKESMIEYYKSQPDRQQWGKDKELLSEYVAPRKAAADKYNSKKIEEELVKLIARVEKVLTSCDTLDTALRIVKTRSYKNYGNILKRLDVIAYRLRSYNITNKKIFEKLDEICRLINDGEAG